MNEQVKTQDDMTQEEQEELVWKCLENSVHSDVGCFLYKAKMDENDNIVNSVVAKELTVKKCRPLLRMAHGYIYLDLEFPADNDLDGKRVRNIYEEYLTNCTRATKNYEIDYFFIINLTGIDENTGLVYVTEYTNPIFMSVEQNIIKFVVDSENVQFHQMEADYDLLNAQLELDEDERNYREQSQYEAISNRFQEEMEDEIAEEMEDDDEDDEDDESDNY